MCILFLQGFADLKMQCQTQHSSSYAVTFSVVEKYVRSRRVSISCSLIPSHLTFSSAIRETERDWDKDLAEDVKGECESKYGPVNAIKVEKETQVSPDVQFSYLSLTIRRARSMSNLTPSRMPKKPSKDSMVVGLVDDKYPQPLSLTLLCKPINRYPQDKASEDILLKHFSSFDTDPPDICLTAFSSYFDVILSQIAVICRSSVFCSGPSCWLSQGGRHVPC
jgi:hypothetical protein